MTESTNRPYFTKSVKVATYLRLYGISETNTSDKVTERNPKGLVVFYYEDGDRVRNALLSYKDDTDFHDQFDCYYEVMRVIHGKADTDDETLAKNSAKNDDNANNYDIKGESEYDE